MSVLTEQHFPDSVVRQTKPSWQCLERGAAQPRQQQPAKYKYTTQIHWQQCEWVKTSPHQPGPAHLVTTSLFVWSPLLAHDCGDTDTWYMEQIRGCCWLIRVCDQISVMGRTQPTTVCMRCCHARIARRPSCQSGHHCWAGAGSLPGWVLHHINTDNNQHCQNCDHVYTPGVHEYMTWGQQWSVYKRCGVLEKAVMWCVTAWQCRQFLRRKMWRFMCYVEALQ